MQSSGGILARSGPSAAAEWRPLGSSRDGARVWAIAGDGGGEGGDQPLFAVREPIVARSPDTGGPLFSLTLTLERQPAPGEPSLLPLVRGGASTMTLDVLPSVAELAAMPGGNPVEPLFPRGVVFNITRADGSGAVVEARSDGASGRAGLSTTLTKENALAVLRALRGEASGLIVQGNVSYRASGPAAAPVRIELDLAAVHGFLAGKTDGDGMLLDVDLVNYFAAMVDQGVVTLAPPSHDAVASARVLLDDLVRLCAPILQKAPGSVAGASSYQLGGSPGNSVPMTFQSGSGATGSLGTFSVSRRLEDVLAPLTRERPLESFVNAVTQNGDGRGFEPIGQLQAGTREATNGSTPMAAMGNTAAALPVMLRTGRALPASAHVLAASDLVLRPERPQRLWALNDLVVDLLGINGRQQHYPQIDDAVAIWPDRITPNSWWYAPELTFVQPEQTSTAASTPFLFSFTPTGHDEQGRPGLEASIRFRLRAQMPATTQQAWEARGKPAMQAVPLNGLSASLEIPFRDAQGRAQAQVIGATSLEGAGPEYDATFELTDQWARLAYGALAITGFQEQPPRLVLSYVFPAYVPVGDRDMPVQWGGKRLTAAVAQADASRGMLMAASTMAVAPNRFTHPPVVSNANLAIVATAVFVPQRSYGVRTQGHTDRVDVTVPCNRFGMLYVQTPSAGGQPQAIGCQDAFTLGQVQLRLYEPLAIELDGAPMPFKVYRSLQVPGRFLVVPDAYTVARFEPGDGRAYRPALFMFSNIDAVQPDRTRCVVMATLQPAVSPYWRSRLVDYLRANVHASAQLEWPTELPVAPVYSWALSSGGPTTGAIEPAVARTPDGFQVSLATGIDGILQLKAMLERGGVNGVATFTLADGSPIQTTLAVDLAKIGGPFVAGPIEVSISNDTAQLTNRIEQALDVGEVYAVNGATGTRVAVEKRIEAGGSLAVAVPAGTGRAEVQSTTAGGPVSLEEVRTFVEDIYVTAVFQASFNFASEKLASVTIEARIAGIGGSTTAQLTAAANRAEVSLVLPLTSYLAQPTLQFSLTRVPTEGPGVTGGWRDWRLDTLGAVIEISSQIIQQG